jgi:hypothetical protein
LVPAEIGMPMKSRTQADPGALSITPPDGYQYGDEHPWDWNPAKQAGVSSKLAELRKDATKDDGAA